MDEKKKVVVLKEPDEKSQKREMLWTFLLPILGGVLTILIVIAAALLPNAMKYSGYSGSENTEEDYSINEEIITVYNNLMTYINNEREDIHKERILEITSLTFKDHHLEVVSYLDSHPVYMKFEMDSYKDIDNVFDAFKKSVPSVGTYAWSNYDEIYNADAGVYIHNKRIKTKTTTFENPNRYVSLLYQYDKETITGYCHALYKNEGYLDDSDLIELPRYMDRDLYDMYYYILHKVES